MPKRIPIVLIVISAIGALMLPLLVMVGLDYLPSPTLGKDEAAYWDIIIKAVGGVLALSGAAITAFKYLDEKAQANLTAQAANVAAEQANETAKKEARKPFDEQRQAIYLDLLSATATIGNTRHNTPERESANDRFWFLYWGPLPLVADFTVGEAVNRFSELMDKPEDEIPLRNASMAIAKACRSSLGYITEDGVVPVSLSQPKLFRP